MARQRRNPFADLIGAFQMGWDVAGEVGGAIAMNRLKDDDFVPEPGNAASDQDRSKFMLDKRADVISRWKGPEAGLKYKSDAMAALRNEQQYQFDAQANPIRLRTLGATADITDRQNRIGDATFDATVRAGNLKPEQIEAQIGASRAATAASHASTNFTKLREQYLREDRSGQVESQKMRLEQERIDYLKKQKVNALMASLGENPDLSSDEILNRFADGVTKIDAEWGNTLRTNFTNDQLKRALSEAALATQDALKVFQSEGVPGVVKWLDGRNGSNNIRILKDGDEDVAVEVSPDGTFIRQLARGNDPNKFGRELINSADPATMFEMIAAEHLAQRKADTDYRDTGLQAVKGVLLEAAKGNINQEQVSAAIEKISQTFGLERGSGKSPGMTAEQYAKLTAPPASNAQTAPPALPAGVAGVRPKDAPPAAAAPTETKGGLKVPDPALSAWRKQEIVRVNTELERLRSLRASGRDVPVSTINELQSRANNLALDPKYAEAEYDKVRREQARQDRRQFFGSTPDLPR